MAIEFKLPDIGEGVAEGEIVKWLVQEGQDLAEDQPMVEIMTDKATVEITSPARARVQKILRAEGDVVPVQEVIVLLDDGAAGSAAKQAPAEQAPVAQTPRVATAPPPAPPAATANGGTQKVLAAPATRKLARERQVDLSQVVGTGPRGRIKKADLLAFLEQPGTKSPPPAGREAPAPARVSIPTFDSAGEERIPYRGLRRAIGEQMARSAQTAPHFTMVEELDLSELWILRKAGAEQAAARGVKLTFLPFIIKALCAAIGQESTLNAHMDDDAGEIIVKRDVHVGIATDTERGLIVPVVKHADRLNMLELAAEIQRLASQGRAGQLSREELVGSTITITSAGSIGGLFATPIINHPEVAILGVYQIKDKPVVRDGQVVPGKVGCLSLTLDHRVLDGGTAARALSHMKTLLEQPGLLLLES